MIPLTESYSLYFWQQHCNP